MKLCGDNPLLYSNDHNKRRKAKHERNSENSSLKYYDLFARSPKARELYRRYHFDGEAKGKGSIVIEICIDNDYLTVISQIQLEMKKG